MTSIKSSARKRGRESRTTTMKNNVCRCVPATMSHDIKSYIHVVVNPINSPRYCNDHGNVSVPICFFYSCDFTVGKCIVVFDTDVVAVLPKHFLNLISKIVCIQFHFFVSHFESVSHDQTPYKLVMHVLVFVGLDFQPVH